MKSVGPYRACRGGPNRGPKESRLNDEVAEHNYSVGRRRGGSMQHDRRRVNLRFDYRNAVIRLRNRNPVDRVVWRDYRRGRCIHEGRMAPRRGNGRNRLPAGRAAWFAAMLRARIAGFGRRRGKILEAAIPPARRRLLARADTGDARRGRHGRGGDRHPDENLTERSDSPHTGTIRRRRRRANRTLTATVRQT